MNSARFPIFLILALALGALANASLFIVKETERAVLLKFGKLVDADLKPGLHLKVPLMHEVRKFDARILTMNARAERYLTLEKKVIIVDSYAKWRISDVGTYYTATSGEEANAEGLLARRVSEGLRNQFAARTLHEGVADQRDELMQDLTKRLNEITRKSLGVEVVDVRVKRIDLPDEVSDTVFNRMISERAREARDHRARGQELAEGIRAEADRQKTVIEAEAYRDAELLRGDGDAKASAIYASAYNKDPEFYAFLRSLQAYKESFSNKADTLVVDPDSDFFKYLKHQGAKP